jgi:hypothetical protein
MHRRNGKYFRPTVMEIERMASMSPFAPLLAVGRAIRALETYYEMGAPVKGPCVNPNHVEKIITLSMRF